MTLYIHILMLSLVKQERIFGIVEALWATWLLIDDAFLAKKSCERWICKVGYFYVFIGLS